MGQRFYLSKSSSEVLDFKDTKMKETMFESKTVAHSSRRGIETTFRGAIIDLALIRRIYIQNHTMNLQTWKVILKRSCLPIETNRT